MSLKRLADGAVLVALAVGILWTVESSRRADAVDTALVNAARTQVRSNFRDRLMATPVDLGFLDLPDSGAFTLYWHVDFDRCEGCFNAVATWNHLAADHRVRTVLSYSGTPDAEALRAIHSMGDTEVREVALADFQRVVGSSLASSKMLLDASGAAILVDTRYSGQECGWSFDDAVMRILTTETADSE